MRTKVSALAGSACPVLFQAVEEAHRQVHGLSAIFVILKILCDGRYTNRKSHFIIIIIIVYGIENGHVWNAATFIIDRPGEGASYQAW